jgi:hypothetical protein
MCYLNNVLQLVSEVLITAQPRGFKLPRRFFCIGGNENVEEFTVVSSE